MEEAWTARIFARERKGGELWLTDVIDQAPRGSCGHILLRLQLQLQPSPYPKLSLNLDFIIYIYVTNLYWEEMVANWNANIFNLSRCIHSIALSISRLCLASIVYRLFVISYPPRG